MQNVKPQKQRKVAFLQNGTVRSVPMTDRDPGYYQRRECPLRPGMTLCSITKPVEAMSRRITLQEFQDKKSNQPKKSTIKRESNFRGLDEMMAAFELIKTSKNSNQ